MYSRFLLPILLALSACGGESNREAGGVSPAEAEALDQAAEMIEAERLPPATNPPPSPAAPAGEAPKPAG